MPDDAIVAPAAEDTARAVVPDPPEVTPAPKLCRYCQQPLTPPKRKGIVKEFCSDRHRAAFRDEQQQAALREAESAVTDAMADLERHAARLSGALSLLDRLKTTPRKAGKKVLDSGTV